MLENLNIKNTTKCDCGREFIITDIQKLERINDKSFYSGVVKHFSKAVCPKCNKNVILLLKQVGQTYKVLKIAEYESDTSKLPAIEEENSIQEESNKKSEELTINNNELICPVCKKECKSKSGLAVHIKKHENNIIN